MMEDNTINNAEEVTSTEEEKKFCRKCGAELVGNTAFCSKCGTPVKRICSKCQTELTDAQDFCPNCGTRYSESLKAIDIQNASKNVSGMLADKKKPLLIALLLIILAVGGFFGYKALTKPNFEKIADEYCKSHKDDDGNEYSFYRDCLYGQNGIAAAMKIGEKGDWIKLDSNPEDIDEDDFDLNIVYYSVTDGLNEILLEKLGFSDVVSEQQDTTTWSMGVQTAESDIATAEWTYHPDKGLEVTYKLK